MGSTSGGKEWTGGGEEARRGATRFCRKGGLDGSGEGAGVGVSILGGGDALGIWDGTNVFSGLGVGSGFSEGVGLGVGADGMDFGGRQLVEWP